MKLNSGKNTHSSTGRESLAVAAAGLVSLSSMSFGQDVNLMPTNDQDSHQTSAHNPHESLEIWRTLLEIRQYLNQNLDSWQSELRSTRRHREDLRRDRSSDARLERAQFSEGMKQARTEFLDSSRQGDREFRQTVEAARAEAYARFYRDNERVRSDFQRFREEFRSWSEEQERQAQDAAIKIMKALAAGGDPELAAAAVDKALQEGRENIGEEAGEALATTEPTSRQVDAAERISRALERNQQGDALAGVHMSDRNIPLEQEQALDNVSRVLGHSREGSRASHNDVDEGLFRSLVEVERRLRVEEPGQPARNRYISSGSAEAIEDKSVFQQQVTRALERLDNLHPSGVTNGEHLQRLSQELGQLDQSIKEMNATDSWLTVSRFVAPFQFNLRSSQGRLEAGVEDEERAMMQYDLRLERQRIIQERMTKQDENQQLLKDMFGDITLIVDRITDPIQGD